MPPRPQNGSDRAPGRRGAPRAGATPPDHGEVSRPTLEDLIAPALVVCSIGAAAIHLATAGEHDPLFGAAFLLMAAFQGAWAVAIVLTRHPLVLLGGVAGHGAIVATWLAAHTNGLPFGPGAGNPEPVGLKDASATVLELVAIGGALLLLRPDSLAGIRRIRVHPRQVPLALGAVLVLTTAAVMAPHAHGPGAHGHAAGAAHAHDESHPHDEDEAHGHDQDEAHGHDEDEAHGHDEDDPGHGDSGDHAHGVGGSEGTHPHAHDGEGSSEPGHDHGGGGGHGDGGHDGHDGDDDPGDDDPGGGDPGEGEGEESRVLAGPFASSAGYATTEVTVEPGGRLSFSNLDQARHDVVHDAAADGFGGSEEMPWCDLEHAHEGHEHGPCPAFWSPLVGSGQSTPVWGIRNLEPGRTYTFYCTLHHNMRGTLTVA